MKRKPSEWEKIIENESTDENLQTIQAAYTDQYLRNKQPN